MCSRPDWSSWGTRSDFAARRLSCSTSTALSWITEVSRRPSRECALRLPGHTRDWVHVSCWRPTPMRGPRCGMRLSRRAGWVRWMAMQSAARRGDGPWKCAGVPRTQSSSSPSPSIGGWPALRFDPTRTFRVSSSTRQRAVSHSPSSPTDHRICSATSSTRSAWAHWSRLSSFPGSMGWRNRIRRSFNWPLTNWRWIHWMPGASATAWPQMSQVPTGRVSQLSG